MPNFSFFCFLKNLHLGGPDYALPTIFLGAGNVHRLLRLLPVCFCVVRGLRLAANVGTFEAGK